MSSIARIAMPADCRPVIALSRPEPGPLTRTSSSLTPNLLARSAHVSAARWAAKGVLLRLPLNPEVPAVAQHNTSALTSVMVTIVLLNVALMYATARVTLRRTFFRFDLAKSFLQTSADALSRPPRSICRAGPLAVGLLVTHLLDALLAGNCLLHALARPRVGSSALAAHRQTPAMPQAAVAVNLAQPRNILLHAAAELAFDDDFLVEIRVDPRDLILGQLDSFAGGIDFQGKTHLDRLGATDAVQISQRDVGRFSVRKVDTLNTRHSLAPPINDSITTCRISPRATSSVFSLSAFSPIGALT